MEDNGNSPFEEVYSPVVVQKKESFKGLDTLDFSRADVIRRLCEKLPMNQLGLPEYIYRTDMITNNLFGAEISNEERVGILEAASFSLDYAEGYPTQMSGSSFWAKLDFEPIEAYTLFTKYLGIVHVTDESEHLIAPVRTYDIVAKHTSTTESKLKELSNLYYWPYRAKAHDLFMVASFQKQKETRALVMEDSHYRKASKWLDKAEARLSAIFDDEEELAELKPKDVFAMFERLVQIQRVSVGLTANGGQGANDGPKNASLEIALRSVAQKAGESAKEFSSSADTMDSILADPESLMQLQELVIRTNHRSGS